MGDAIPQLAQIVGVVDVFDALTSARPYRSALRLEDAVHHLLMEVEQGRMSRVYVQAFLDTMRWADVASVH